MRVGVYQGFSNTEIQIPIIWGRERERERDCLIDIDTSFS